MRDRIHCGSTQRGAARRLRSASCLLPALLLVTVGCTALRLPGGWTVNFPGLSGDPIPATELGRRIRLPKGFTISTWADGIPNARILRFTPRGDLLVSAPRQKKVFLVPPSPDGHVGGTPRVLLDQLNLPHGLALHDGWLYVAETDAVLRVRFDATRGEVSGTAERVVTGLPAGERHWTRTVGFGPDGRMYVSVGSSCNACIEKDPRRAALLRFRPDGSEPQIYATGLRNSVGFAWRPGTGELYATDNGRDLLGDDFPPCEVNRIVEHGFYGWPFANGDRVPDPDNGAGRAGEIADSIPPAHALGAHTAPLGIAFYTGGTFPERYHGAAFVAEHGSWNRSRKNGYKIVALHFDADGGIREEDFAVGFELDEKVHGRPVDLAVGPDGALYVSDDFTGSVYRIAHGEKTAAASAVAPAPRAAHVDPLAGLGERERQESAARGSQLWSAYGCAGCHSAAGSPTYKPLESLGAKYDLPALVEYLHAPQPPMPAFALDEKQRRDLAVYLFEQHGRDSRPGGPGAAPL